MASKYQSSLNPPVSANSRILKLSSLKQQKNNQNTKKLFSRKPLNVSQNCSRIMSSRLKTQQEEPNCPKNQESNNNSLNNLINQSKSIKFVSTKNSQSLQKLFGCSSAQQLPTLSPMKSKKEVSDQEKVNKFNFKDNKLNQSPKFTEDFKLKSSQLDVIYDLEKEDYNSKDLLGSTELSSNDNICNQDSNEDEFKNHQPQRSKRNQTFSFYYSKDYKNLHKECPGCLINSQKIKELNDMNRKLEEIILEKQHQINKLSDKNQKLSRSLKENETLKTSLEYEIRILKEKDSFISSQKDQIDSALKKLQVSYAKLSQQMKYKELELNIHKIYKTKSHEMEMKVEMLKKELNRAKNSVTKLMTSKSSESLLVKNWKPDLRIVGDFKRQNSEKMLKQPKIARVYTEDSIFSLSSEDCD